MLQEYFHGIKIFSNIQNKFKNVKKQFVKSPKLQRNLLKYEYEEDLSQSFLDSFI